MTTVWITLTRVTPPDRWYMGQGQPGCPWPGGDRIEVETSAIVAVGVLHMYGDARKNYLVRLGDGREGFVRLSSRLLRGREVLDCQPDTAKVLRRAVKDVLALPPRGGWALEWRSVIWET